LRRGAHALKLFSNILRIHIQKSLSDQSARYFFIGVENGKFFDPFDPFGDRAQLREDPRQYQFVLVTSRIAKFRPNGHMQEYERIFMNPRVDKHTGEVLFVSAINKSV
jgi:hypothetical protein